MTEACCPNCGHRIAPAVPEQSLERLCRDRGLPVTVDGRVSENVAAEILGRSPDTLRNWSYADAPLPFVKVRGRRTYRLDDIAEMLRR